MEIVLKNRGHAHSSAKGEHVNINLARAASLRVCGDTAGVELICREGTAWVTLEGDSRDHVLLAGDRFGIQAHRLALVTSLTESAQLDVVLAKRSTANLSLGPSGGARYSFGGVPCP